MTNTDQTTAEAELATDDTTTEPTVGTDGAAVPPADEDGAAAEDTAATEPVSGVDSDEAEVAADYLEELLDIADLDGDIDTYVDGDRAHVSIVSESQVLVGKEGQVLDALQELTRLAVLADTGQRSRLMLDVAGYRGKRRQELVALADDAVTEVKDTS